MKYKNKRSGKDSIYSPERREEINRRLALTSNVDNESLYFMFDTSPNGLNEAFVDDIRDIYGRNTVTRGRKVSILEKICGAFINPFTVILLLLAVVSLFTDIILAPPEDVNYMTVVIIMTMVVISGLLRFIQEARSGHAAENLLKMIKTTTCIERKDKGLQEIPIDEVVVGDIVHLSAGDMIPADIRIITARDLFVSQSALTGESKPIEKTPDPQHGGAQVAVTELPNIAFLGTSVISGTAKGLVVASGDDTVFGDMAHSIEDKPVPTTFEKGVNSVSWVLIRFMLVMVPIVFVVNGITKNDWLHALLFAISIAVGLTPEMLPMIVTTCLAKGAVAMSKEKTIIKHLNSIQNLGSMDILCTDKTGTITQDKVVLEYHLNLNGEEDVRVLRHAFLNSYYQTGLKNLMDRAIIDRTMQEQEQEATLRSLSTLYAKVDEIPFDFHRRRMSVVVERTGGRRQMITKGAMEEMLGICTRAEYGGTETLLTEEIKGKVMEDIADLNDDGMRVIGIARKFDPSPAGTLTVADEIDMTLIGYLAFLDPPKDSAAKAVKALGEYGVEVKVLTGDNDKVTKSVCRHVGIPSEVILLGSDLERMSDEELAVRVRDTDVFAKLSPPQKSRVIKVLRSMGHSVGYMGDGINDAAAMRASDVGISVDTAVDVAKESAGVILLEKDLMVLAKGIVEGRKTYANMIKYIKMTASSNFGNMFSVLIASAFLPFLPMMSIQLILLNLIYDLSCTTIPWDNVDKEFLRVPRKWDASSIGKFMVWIGPTSSVFDITTYLLMYFVICPMMCGGLVYSQLIDPAMRDYYEALFQTGWFVESMWSQTLVIHMIRTPKIPFIQSRASWPVTLLTVTGIAVLTAIPFTALGRDIGLAALPWEYFPWLGLTIVLYMILATVFKKIFIRRYGELL